MEFGKSLKIAMVNNDIGGAKQLSDLSGITYSKTVRAINGDKSSRISDVIDLAESMGLELKFVTSLRK